MKRKFRIITVNHQKYAWWFSFQHGVKLHFSPQQDKTAGITVDFPSETSDDFYAVFPLFISMQKAGISCRIKLIEPKMSSLLIAYLQDDFQSRKQIFLNGFDLLSEMGWHVSGIENGFDW
ncbi:MAG: hypothetical protein IJ644_03550 [Oscillospiraceae bacterium]|nr:hypothetical protein [Oscillospiraceae bacterium]